MLLRDFLETRKIEPEVFAKKLGVARWTVVRYLEGRIPETPMLKKILAESDGLVTPNDFFIHGPQQRTEVRRNAKRRN